MASSRALARSTSSFEGAAPAYIAWARERIDEGRAEAGRTDERGGAVLYRTTSVFDRVFGL